MVSGSNPDGSTKMELHSLPDTGDNRFYRKAYTTIGAYKIEDVLAAIAAKPSKATLFDFNNEPHIIRVHSARLRLFKNNLKCVSCSREGNIFLLQVIRYPSRDITIANCLIEECTMCAYVPLKTRKETPHLNLWHLHKGGMRLMTKDHIYPKSKGGSDRLDNLQTMCVNCNNAKADTIPTDV